MRLCVGVKSGEELELLGKELRRETENTGRFVKNK